MDQKQHWKICERIEWARCAYGKRVMLETSDGTLTAELPHTPEPRNIYLNAEIEGRMLVQLLCNGVTIYCETQANRTMDDLITLQPCPQGLTHILELHFIPATNGKARIARDICTVRKSEHLDMLIPA